MNRTERRAYARRCTIPKNLDRLLETAAAAATPEFIRQTGGDLAKMGEHVLVILCKGSAEERWEREMLGRCAVPPELDGYWIVVEPLPAAMANLDRLGFSVGVEALAAPLRPLHTRAVFLKNARECFVVPLRFAPSSTGGVA